MAGERTRAAIFADIVQEQHREFEPTNTLNRHISQARKEMGEAEWQRLNREWGA